MKLLKDERSSRIGRRGEEPSWRPGAGGGKKKGARLGAPEGVGYGGVSPREDVVNMA